LLRSSVEPGPALGSMSGGPRSTNAEGNGACTVVFRVRAETSFGDSIVLVGSGSALGQWDPLNGGVPLTTTAEEYPLWTSGPIRCPVPTACSSVEYKYVRITSERQAEWEAEGGNRCLPTELAQHQHQRMVIDDGTFSYVQRESFGYPEGARPTCPGPTTFRGVTAGSPRLVIVGDAVAAGHRAWRFEGWAARLSQKLHERFGYAYANLADTGLGAHGLRSEFKDRVAPLQPSVVVIAIGLELQQLAKCPEYERSQVCKQFLSTLEDLAEMTWEIGALPMLGAPYPHADFGAEHTALLRQTHSSMRQWGVPVLDWLDTLAGSGENGRWAEGLSHDAVHPNTEGHKRMFASIDAAMFEPSQIHAKLLKGNAALKSGEEHLCFADGNGFEVRYIAAKSELIVNNKTRNEYQLNTGWAKLQESLKAAKGDAPWILKRGLYIPAGDMPPGASTSVSLGDSGCVETEANIPGGCSVTLRNFSTYFKASPAAAAVLFYDGNLAVIRTEAGMIVVNQATCEYNVHPMWQDVRLATRALPQGIYEDDSGCPFRTAVISAHGLQSRVKVPSKAAVHFKRTGPLSSLKRIAVLPLGDRCSIRMLMHKIEYDGPCYPFDLTRSTSLADVADMIATGFSDMWNEHLLEYNHEAGRIFHKKWHGLSYAHEVEDGDDPICNFGAVVARMSKRYSGRAARFDYAAKHADSVLFLRTGVASRGEVTDMLTRVCARFPGLHASLLLISDQPSEEFSGLLGVSHVRESFDPDRMYEDMDYWMSCAYRFRGILESHGINARSLYWCPNNLKEAEREVKEAEAAEAARKEAESEKADGKVDPLPKFHNSQVTNFSHSNLYALETAHGA